MSTRPLRKEKLEVFKKQLLARRDALSVGVRQKTAEIIDDDVFFADAVDQASNESDKEITVAMKNREEGMLTQINAALRRIEDGSFGECQSCGEIISEARLTAFPLTTLCIDCKAEIESEEQRFQGKG